MRRIAGRINKIQPRHSRQSVVTPIRLMVEYVRHIESVDPGVIRISRWYVMPEVVHGRYLSQLMFLIKFGYCQPLPIVFCEGEAIDIVEITMHPWQENAGLSFKETEGMFGRGVQIKVD